MARNKKQSTQFDFEAAMGELESLVEKMEQGEFSLEESIRQFERGTALVRSCQKSLRTAEQKVMKLTGGNDAEMLENLESPNIQEIDP